MLKGERAEPYLTPSRERRLVCQLCAPRAQQRGLDPRVGRARRRRRSPQRPPERRGAAAPPAPRSSAATTTDARSRPERRAGERAAERAPGDERARRAVPARAALARRATRATCAPCRPTPQLKIERALELFNASEHPRTVAGIARTLGPPHASAWTSQRLRRGGAADGGVGAVLVPVRRRPVRRARAGAARAAQGRSSTSCRTRRGDWNCRGRREGAVGAAERRTEPAKRRAPRNSRGRARDEDSRKPDPWRVRAAPIVAFEADSRPLDAPGAKEQDDLLRDTRGARRRALRQAHRPTTGKTRTSR